MPVRDFIFKSCRSVPARLGSLFVVMLVMACSTSPTGRRQLTLMPESQLQQMGQASFEQIKQEKEIVTDAAVKRRVQCVVNNLVDHLGGNQNGEAWDVVVFKDPSANAFALPGKKIGVFTGILDIAKTNDQLATVIGHEIGHVIADHSNERVSQAFLAQGGLAAAQAALGKDGKSNQLLMAALGAGVQFGVLMPFSRKHESEADQIGLGLMAEAGFDPQASLKFWQSMGQSSKGQPPEWLSTHPSHQSRINLLKESMGQALATYRQAEKPQCP